MATCDRVVIFDKGIYESSPMVYAFTGSGQSSVYLKDEADAVVRSDSDKPIMVFISGTLRPNSWWSKVDDSQGTKITLASPRVFPNNADCVISFHA